MKVLYKSREAAWVVANNGDILFDVSVTFAFYGILFQTSWFHGHDTMQTTGWNSLLPFPRNSSSFFEALSVFIHPTVRLSNFDWFVKCFLIGSLCEFIFS